MVNCESTRINYGKTFRKAAKALNVTDGIRVKYDTSKEGITRKCQQCRVPMEKKGICVLHQESELVKEFIS